MLLDKLRDFFGSLTDIDASNNRPDKSDPKIASAALFYHVIQADGKVDDAEIARLTDILSSEFGVSASDATELYQAGKQADEEAVDLYSFTSILKVQLDEAQKISLVEILWELAYADGERHELEDHVIWRISDLLGVSGRDRVLARKKAEEENPHLK